MAAVFDVEFTGRCSIVDYRGVVLYDKFVKPPEPVVDYRSPWSGLHAIHIAQGIPFVVAQQQISNILQVCVCWIDLFQYI